MIAIGFVVRALRSAFGGPKWITSEFSRVFGVNFHSGGSAFCGVQVGSSLFV